MEQINTHTASLDGDTVTKETMRAFVASVFVVSLLINLFLLVAWLTIALA